MTHVQLLNKSGKESDSVRRGGHVVAINAAVLEHCKYKLN